MIEEINPEIITIDLIMVLLFELVYQIYWIVPYTGLEWNLAK